jgi:glucokinase-like ROK family protein
VNHEEKEIMDQRTFLGSNINLVKAHNLRAVLLSLLHQERVSRVELAQKTSLSTTTITNLVAEMLSNGIVVEEGAQEPDGQRAVGRPRTALQLVPNARFAVGVHIGVGVLRVALTNLFAEIQSNRIHNFQLDEPAGDVIDQIGYLVESVINESGADRARVIGVGVGASGLVNVQTGINVLAPSLGWRDTPIREPLERKLGLPIVVDNNVRAMAVGEAFFGAGRGVNSLAFVYGRTGVGAGFVVGGQVYRGSGAGAGEIGHVIMVPDGGELCRCGRHGCLETLVSEGVIVRQALALARGDPDGILARLLDVPGDTPIIERIFAAARQGDIDTRLMIEQKACYLGIALANLVNILNPELILLGGMFAQAQDLMLPVAAQKMHETAFAGLGEKVRVGTTSFGWRAGVVGAAALALTQFFYQQTEDI